MLLSEFRVLLESVFGSMYGPTLSRRLALTRLGSRTAEEALEAGTDPRDVWHALCDEMDVPDSARNGGDRTRIVPPPR